MDRIKKIAIAGTASAVIFGSLATGAFAAPGTGACVKAGHQFVIGIYNPDDAIPGDSTPSIVGNPDTYTLGDAISAGFMGNTSNDNPDSNGVLPSLSPGPHTLGGGFLTWGSLVHGAVPANCN